jgi:hypothetical protein
MKTKSQITKTNVPVSMDKKLAALIAENVSNKSKYIEWLVYQDMMKNNVEGIKEVLV